MYLALYTLLIILLTVHTIADCKKIKSNREVMKLDNQIIKGNEELRNKLDERNKLLKESQNLQEKTVKNLEELKVKISLDYDKLPKEAVKRINEQNNSSNIKVNF